MCDKEGCLALGGKSCHQMPCVFLEKCVCVRLAVSKTTLTPTAQWTKNILEWLVP